MSTMIDHTSTIDHTTPAGPPAHLSRLLSAALLDEVLAVTPEDSGTAWERVLHLDAAVRRGDATLVDLDELTLSLRGDPTAREVRPWLESLRAELLLWGADLGAVFIAQPLLHELPDDPLVPTRTLVPRARLRRIMAFAALFAGDAEGAAELVAGASADFGRAGWHAERALTLSLHALVHVGVFMDDLELMVSVAAEAADELARLSSPLEEYARAIEVFVSFAAGNMPSMQRALTRLEQVAEPGGLAELSGGALGALAAFLGDPADVSRLEHLEARAAVLRRRFCEVARMVSATVGHAMVDLGRIEEAAHWAELAEYAAERTVIGTRDRAALRLRLRLHGQTGGAAGEEEGGVEVVAERALAFVGEVAAGGLRRDAGAKALRFAADLRRLGRDEEAGRLASFADEHLPAPPQRSVWEALWGARRDSADAATVEVTVLSSHVGISRGGVRRILKGHTARLLAVLVAADGEIGTERLIDRMWPDADLEAGRNRLNVTVHRLKRALDAPGAGVISRRAGSVRFEPLSGWRVDAWEFRRLVGGTPAQRRAAVELYGDHLANQQLAYDDAVVEERHLLAALLTGCLHQLLADPDLDTVATAERVLRLELDDHELRLGLARRLELEGSSALAARLLA